MAILGFITKYKVIIGVALLVVLASAPSVYFFRQYQAAQMRINNPTEAAKQDAKDTIAAVAKLMMLSEGEEPTVMQVTDVSKLKDQPFFVNAKNGDKVIIYTKAKKAILYRPSVNKIIDVAPVNIGNTATPSAQTNATPSAILQPDTPSAAPKIIIQ
ncbi:MAG: hypothetical protein NT149_04975 [Candidatus Gottesmanbacteria bacterium]|nr:hypothetical protein [Candidatus Gottesmanbacteria bacterium]